MPVSPLIASAAYSFATSTGMMEKSFQGLSTEEWLRRPNGNSNHMLWVAGHVIWARAAVMGLLGQPWSQPWFPLFARGSKTVGAEEYPASAEILNAFAEASTRLTAALDAATDEALSAPGPERIPSADKTLAGTILFLAHHDAYHVGQAAYIRAWLGHGGITG
jgi:uncharacterized damage-inducible protein DinB